MFFLFFQNFLAILGPLQSIKILETKKILKAFWDFILNSVVYRSFLGIIYILILNLLILEHDIFHIYFTISLQCFCHLQYTGDNSQVHKARKINKRNKKWIAVKCYINSWYAFYVENCKKNILAYQNLN